jgi:transcriptional regulator with XRE-family HTH domain
MPARRADANDAVVGHNIRVHRLARKMSQSALAGEIGITFQQVQKYEKGANRVGAGRLVAIATVLDVPVMTLLAGVPGAGRKSPAPSAVALIANAQPLRLVQAFAAINDKGMRRALMTLTEGIARLAQRGQRRA